MLFRKAQPRLKKLYSLLLPHDELQYVPHQGAKTFSIAMSSAPSIKLLKQTGFFSENPAPKLHFSLQKMEKDWLI